MIALLLCGTKSLHFVSYFFYSKSSILGFIGIRYISVFDIFKPYPINLIDAELANGLGVMLDDVVAAFYTLLCLALVKLLV